MEVMWSCFREAAVDRCVATAILEPHAGSASKSARNGSAGLALNAVSHG